MRRTLWLSLVAVVALVGCSSSWSTNSVAGAVPTLNAEQLRQLAASTEWACLDVRTPQEVATHGTLARCINIPVSQLEQRLAEVPRGRPVVIVCWTGRRATAAARTLMGHGIPVRGIAGLKDYIGKGYPVVFPGR